MDKIRLFKSRSNRHGNDTDSLEGDKSGLKSDSIDSGTSVVYPLPIPGMTMTAFRVDPEAEETAPPNEDDEELGSVEKQKSVIMHVLSQIKQGKELAEIVLPTFILEKHSLLEMFADYMAHPLMFINITNGASPKERIINLVKWFLLSLHAGKRDKIAKKPYNPVIGELFHCSWRLVDSNEGAQESSRNDLLHITYTAEQVSHHPPVSAIRFHCPKRKMEMVAGIHTRPRWKGLSIYVNLIGKVTLKLGEHHDEEYQFSLPTTYGRSVLTVPWVELGDEITITCPQTGYRAHVKFHTKNHREKRLHEVSGEVISPLNATSIFTVEGHWNATLRFSDKETGEMEEVDTSTLKIESKFIRPEALQAPEESQRLWSGVTRALRTGDIDQATAEKTKLEEMQRRSEQAREKLNLPHVPRYFEDTPNGYIFIGPQ